MNKKIDKKFECFWKIIKSTTIWGGIIRATRYHGYMIQKNLKQCYLSNLDCTIIAKKINAIPEHCKNSEETIKFFLKSDPEFIKVINQFN